MHPISPVKSSPSTADEASSSVFGAATARARQVSSISRSRSTETPTSLELRTAPGLLRVMRTQVMPNSSSTSMATCSASVSTRWNCEPSTKARMRLATRL